MYFMHLNIFLSLGFTRISKRSVLTKKAKKSYLFESYHLFTFFKF